jgi:hypothetical protein
MWNISTIFGSMIPDVVRHKCEIKSRIAMEKVAFNKKKARCTSKLDVDLRNKPVKCYIWSIALCGAETGTVRKVDLKYMESSEMWCCRRIENISWTGHARNEVLRRVKEEE